MSGTEQEKNYGPDDTSSFFSSWFKSCTSYWETFLQEWLGQDYQRQSRNSQEEEEKHVPFMSLSSWTELWRSFQKNFQDTEASKSMPHLMETIPELGIKIGYMAMEEWFRLFQETLQGMGSENGSGKKEKDNSVQALKEAYEQGFHKIFNIPQLGVTRFYQERMNQSLDEFNRFLLDLGEFFRLMNLPLEKSFIELNEKIAEKSQHESYSEDLQDSYQMWLDILEKHFNQLYNSPEFIQSLHTVLNRYTDWYGSQQEVLKDILQFLPVSSKDDLDELAKENYQLKKEIKKLAKRVETLENQIQESSSEKE